MATLATPARPRRVTEPQRLVALAAISLCLQALPALAQNAAVPGDGAALIDSLLGHGEAFRLSPDQARQLRLLRLDTQIQEAPLIAQRQAIELQLQRGRIADPAYKAPNQVLSQFDQLGAQIAQAERAAAGKADDILTPAQRTILSQSASPTNLSTAAGGALNAPLNAASDSRLKDNKLVEYETSEAIANRLIEWAKTFALLLGAPLTILAAVLTILGLRSYADFKDKVQKAREAIEGQMQEATGMQQEFAALRGRLTELAGIEHSVSEIAAQVNRIERFVGFQKSDALTPTLQASLEDALTRYRAWLANIGSLPTEMVTVFVDPNEKNNAFYMPGKIVIAEVLAGDPDVVLREYTHHVLKEAKEQAVPWTAIQSGFADYLPCSFNNNPLFGAKSAPVFNRIYNQNVFPNGYVRNMVNQVRLDTPSGQGISHQKIGEGWGGAFWEMRTLLGHEQCDPLLIDAWKAAKIREDSPASFAEFARTILAFIAERHPDAAAEVKAIFERRGVDLATKKRHR